MQTKQTPFQQTIVAQQRLHSNHNDAQIPPSESNPTSTLIPPVPPLVLHHPSQAINRPITTIGTISIHPLHPPPPPHSQVPPPNPHLPAHRASHAYNRLFGSARTQRRHPALRPRRRVPLLPVAAAVLCGGKMGGHWSGEVWQLFSQERMD